MKQGVKVLVACDDNHLLQKLALLISSTPEMTANTLAELDRDSVERVRSLQPDVILLKLRRPPLKGLSWMKQLSAADVVVPVVVLTSAKDMQTFHRALLAGARAYLLKGSSRSDIISALRHVVHGNAYLSPVLITRILDRYRSALQEPMPTESSLSPREVETMNLVAKGLSNGEIAFMMGLAETTVKSYVSRILRKAGARDRAQLVALVHASSTGGIS